MRQIRIILWAVVALALVGGGILLLSTRNRSEAPVQSPMSAGFGGPFTLVGADGRQFGSNELEGKPYALFFGFTHCPDTCPTTLARLVKLRRELGRGEEGFKIVFVTVDPERDGPKEMATYSNAFGSPVIGLTGSPAQIEKVKKQFGIYSEKVPAADGDYSVDHTATVLLFDREGKFVATISPDEQDAASLAKLKRITA